MRHANQNGSTTIGIGLGLVLALAIAAAITLLLGGPASPAWRPAGTTAVAQLRSWPNPNLAMQPRLDRAQLLEMIARQDAESAALRAAAPAAAAADASFDIELRAPAGMAPVTGGAPLP